MTVPHYIKTEAGRWLQEGTPEYEAERASRISASYKLEMEARERHKKFRDLRRTAEIEGATSNQIAN